MYGGWERREGGQTEGKKKLEVGRKGGWVERERTYAQRRRA